MRLRPTMNDNINYDIIFLRVSYLDMGEITIVENRPSGWSLEEIRVSYTLRFDLNSKGKRILRK